MNQVRIYDSYSSEVNFLLSNNESLPTTIELERAEPLISSISATGINLGGNTFDQPTQSLADVLSAQPGVDIRDGRLFIKGSDQVRFFIDGIPVMGQATIGRIW